MFQHTAAVRQSHTIRAFNREHSFEVAEYMRKGSLGEYDITCFGHVYGRASG